MATEFRKTQHPAFPEIYLYKRKDTDQAPWQYSFYVSEAMNNGGKAKNHRKSAKTQDTTKAMQVAAAAYLAIKNATDDGEQVTLSGMPTVNDAYEKARGRYKHRIALGDCRPGTWTSIEKYYDRELAGYFGRKEVRKVTNSMWNDFLTDLIERKPGLRPDTIRLTKGALRSVLKAARREHWIDSTPDLDDDLRFNGGDTRRAWFDWLEQYKLLLVLDENVRAKTRKSDLYSAESLRDFCHMMLYNGIRPGELRVIRFCDVSLHSDKDHRSGKVFSYTQIKLPHVEGAKVGSRTTVGIKGSGEAFQRIMKRRVCGANSKELLFDQNNTSKFRELLEENKLRFDKDGKKRDFESLRHSFICNQLLEGEDHFQLAKNCGTSVAVIEKHYAKHIGKADYKKYAKFKARLREKEALMKDREENPYFKKLIEDE
ncbi:MAG: hypothetical protein JAZ02_08310 [Candidatus Thiodiazotropha endolucinida]|nr:hypothetical protein [Candidatus Thiodiazotropha endolucinida]